MAVLEVLTEVVGAVELFGLIALAEFVNVRKVFNSVFPILLWKVREFFAAVAASVAGGSIGSLSIG